MLVLTLKIVALERINLAGRRKNTQILCSHACLLWEDKNSFMDIVHIRPEQIYLYK